MNIITGKSHIYMLDAGGPACGEQAIFLPAPAVHMEWSSILKEDSPPSRQT
jgi:hypothetical protein